MNRKKLTKTTVPFTAGYFLPLLILPFLFFAFSQKSKFNGVSVSEKGNKVSLENGFVKLDFNNIFWQ